MRYSLLNFTVQDFWTLRTAPGGDSLAVFPVVSQDGHSWVDLWWPRTWTLAFQTQQPGSQLSENGFASQGETYTMNSKPWCLNRMANLLTYSYILAPVGKLHGEHKSTQGFVIVNTNIQLYLLSNCGVRFMIWMFRDDNKGSLITWYPLTQQVKTFRIMDRFTCICNSKYNFCLWKLLFFFAA